MPKINVLISSETGSEWRTVLGHPQLMECMARGSELRGSDVYLHIVKKMFSGVFFLFKFSQSTMEFFLEFCKKKKKN